MPAVCLTDVVAELGVAPSLISGCEPGGAAVWAAHLGVHLSVVVHRHQEYSLRVQAAPGQLAGTPSAGPWCAELNATVVLGRWVHEPDTGGLALVADFPLNDGKWPAAMLRLGVIQVVRAAAAVTDQLHASAVTFTVELSPARRWS